MITTKLIGRFGNQVFQVCAAIAYALEHGMDYHIPAVTENPKIWPAAFTHLENKNYNPALPVFEIKEYSHAYQRLPFNPQFQGNVLLNGYWQSEKYFVKHIDKLREILQLNIKHRITIPSCAIHVRRGDYLTFADKHPTVTLDYLKKAIQVMNNAGINRFMVFSDDLKWCRNNINYNTFFGNVFQYADELPRYDENPENPFYEWLHMACYSNQIISNSSFSLTAAIFNPNPGKIIVAPAQWFGPGNAHLETKDMYPKNCIVI